MAHSEEPPSGKIPMIEGRVVEKLHSKGYEQAKFVRLNRSSYRTDIAPVFCWLINTYMKLNNARFDILDNQKKLHQSVVKQFIDSPTPAGVSRPSKSECSLL